jgi:DNA-directed RNA polymerase subunit RPC12/RpoP
VAEIIKFKCFHCQTALQAGSDFAGQKGKCPNCNKEITVPEKDSNSPDGKRET